MPTDRTTALPDETRAVLREIGDERSYQLFDCEWTAEHDDSHTTQEWAWLLSQRAVALSCPWPAAVFDARRQLVEIAAIAAAAIESLDRLAKDSTSAAVPASPIPSPGRRIS